MSKYRYIVGTGWWCDENSNNDLRRAKYGSEAIREADFHQLWYRSICQSSNPEKIIMVDSASKIIPELRKDDDRLEFISLTHNAGHATHHSGKYSGWLRSVLIGLEYALLCDVDYFVYIEQDVLLHGEGFVDHCINHMVKPYMFGSGDGTPQILQQSLFIVRKDGISKFIERLHRIPYPDCKLSPEDKFFIASSRINVHFLSFILCKLRQYGKNKTVNKFMGFISRGYDFLPVGFGRLRPILFDSKFYYFQHGTSKEIDKYLACLDK